MITSGFGFGGGALIGSGGLTFLGSWDANTNNPFLQSGIGICGGYYIVSVSGTTNLDGVNDWQVGDWAIFECNSNQWQKIDNHDIQAYTTIQQNGIGLPQQSVIDFQGTGVAVSNGVGSTIVTIQGNIPATNYGLYVQTANSTPITGTALESSLIGSGLGTLSVPANGFSNGDSFRADFGGLMSSRNNETLRIKVKSGSVILADSGLQTMPLTTNRVWSLNINFCIRQIGGTSVASIVTLFNFLHIKQSNGTSEGFATNNVNNTTFDTTTINSLNVTLQWGSNNASNTIYSDIFVLNKIY
jgi:hypothetical protein